MVVRHDADLFKAVEEARRITQHLNEIAQLLGDCFDRASEMPALRFGEIASDARRQRPIRTDSGAPSTSQLNRMRLSSMSAAWLVATTSAVELQIAVIAAA